MGDFLVFVKPTSDSSELALIIVEVVDTSNGFVLVLIDKCLQVLLLVMLLHLGMIGELTEVVFEFAPVFCGVLVESVGDFFDWS